MLRPFKATKDNRRSFDSPRFATVAQDDSIYGMNFRDGTLVQDGSIGWMAALVGSQHCLDDSIVGGERAPGDRLLFVGDGYFVEPAGGF
jgi:hypothetical protein